MAKLLTGAIWGFLFGFYLASYLIRGDIYCELSIVWGLGAIGAFTLIFQIVKNWGL